MRLLSLQGREWIFSEYDEHPPPYAILSHTWNEDNSLEVSYQDIRDGVRDNLGKDFYKLRWCQEQAAEDGYTYFWVDTCCIDKRNDAEIAYAIRSMFRWYKEAAVCYVYLSDINIDQPLKNARWFTRGWTLQEMVASKQLEIFASNGYLGNSNSLLVQLYQITGIDLTTVSDADIPSKLSWVRNRSTKRPEDLAYCLMGVCGVMISPMYGEGFQEAKRRLLAAIQERYGSSAVEPLLDMQGISFARLSALHDIQQERALSSEQQRRAYLQRLRFEGMDARRDNIRSAATNTCSWILSNMIYSAWLRCDNALLWLKGKPGAGKSVLIRFMHENMQGRIAKDDIVLSFYFNARGEILEKSFLGLYRSLLAQLLHAVPSSLALLDTLRTTRVEIKLLQRLFSSAVQHCGRRVWCFIDALDECHEQDVGELVEYLRKIKMQVCFASRHYPILDIPTKLQLVLEDVDEHHDDLVAYIDDNLRLDATRLEPVKRAILLKARGVFLWVVIVVKILQKEFLYGRVHAVEARLRSVPSGLSELFTDIVQRDNENMDEFTLCLKWILFARAPMRLREWYFAMISWFDPAQLLWRPSYVSEQEMHSFLLSSSKGFAELITTEQQNSTLEGNVQFIHESVSDFLLKDNGFQQLCQENSSRQLIAHAHEQLKTCCVRGLDTSRVRANISTVMLRLPFALYATTFVLEHAEQASAEYSQSEFLTRDFDFNNWKKSLHRLAVRRTVDGSSFEDLSALCAASNHAGLLHSLITDADKSRVPSLISVAIKGQSWGALMVLLQKDGAEQARDIVADVRVKTQDKATPAYTNANFTNRLSLWRWAIYYGVSKIARHFGQSIVASDLTWQSELGSFNALALAILSRDLSTVEYVIQEAPELLGTTCGWRDHKHRTPLMLAAEQRCTGIVKLLVDSGTNLLWSIKSHTPFAWACQYLEYEHIKELEMCGLRPEWNCVSIAAQYRTDERIIELLLRLGASVEIFDEVGRTPLHYACIQGDKYLAQKLCSPNIIDVKDKNGNTPISYARSNVSNRSQDDIDDLVTLLLQCGAKNKI